MGTFSGLWQNYGAAVIALGKNLLIAVLIILVSWLCCRIVRSLINRSFRKFRNLDVSIGKVFYSAARIFIWLIALLIILGRFGVNTAGIVTVLGTAGLAVGLALKDSLSNIAAGLMIFTLRPYRSGESVECGAVRGTIREMGLFSTEVMTEDGLYIMIPNRLVINAPVKNFSRNPVRRADIAVPLPPGKSLPRSGVEKLQSMLASHPDVKQEPAPPAVAAELTNNTVRWVVRFWVAQEKYADVCQEIGSRLEAMMNAAETEGVPPTENI